MDSDPLQHCLTPSGQRAGRRLNRAWRSTEGSAIVMVLVMLLVVTTLVGAVMLVYLAQYRFVRRDVHRQQAVYTAEAAVHAALARFEDDPAWRANGAMMEVLDAEPAPRVWVRAYGGYLQIRADAAHGRSSATVQALFGQAPPDAFERAMVLGDTTTALTLTGQTRITGGVRTGSRGVRAAPLRRHPFTGSLRGEVERVDEEPLPPYDGRLFEETIGRFNRYLDALPEDLPNVPTDVPVGERRGEGVRALLEDEHVFSDSLRILWAGGEATLTESDSALVQTPVWILSRGDLTVAGALRLASGSVLLAGGTLRIEGPVVGGGCVLFGDRVEIYGGAQLSGQVLARRAIAVEGGSELRYPSVLFAGGEEFVGPAEDRIEIGDAVVNGTVVYPPAEGGRDERVRVVLSEDSRLRGSAYNGRRTEAAGRIEGSLLTAQTYFFASPAAYVNWLDGPTIDRPSRPEAYVVPAAFERPRMRPLAWIVSGAGPRAASDTLNAR